jgi:DedD protein
VQEIELRIPAPDKVGEFVPGVAASEVAGDSPFAASAVEEATGVAAPAAAPASPPLTDGNSRAEAQGKMQTASDKQTGAKRADQPTGGESFVAQVGAYASADAAKQEFDRLKKLGFRKVYTEKVEDMTRVRVGPYAERDKAEQVSQMLEKHGLKPVVMSAR